MSFLIKYKNSKSYYIKYKQNGKWLNKSLKTSDIKIAKNILLEYQLMEIEQNKSNLITKNKPVKEILNDKNNINKNTDINQGFCTYCHKPIYKMDKEILTTKEAAEFLGYAYSTFRSLVCNGLIPVRGRKGSPRFFKSELIEWVKCGMPDVWQFKKMGKY